MDTNDPKLNEQEAFSYIINYLTISQTDGTHKDADLIISEALAEYVRLHLNRVPKIPHNDDPFIKYNFSVSQDAAAHLCRMGVLRIGAQGYAVNDKVTGHAYSLTTQGKEWLGRTDEFIYQSPSHFPEILAKYNEIFGDGFRQRAQEACNTYLAGCYLSACIMCGAAAESIVLNLMIKRVPQNEQQIIKKYEARGGTHATFKDLVGQLKR
jgi:hypothetical protein